MHRDFDELPNDPELTVAASALREEWRLEEEEYTRAAEQHWAHSRTLRDVVRELMHRGDVIAIEVGHTTFSGTIVAVGDDYLQLLTPTGPVDVRLDGVPLVVRVIERAQAGGCRAEPGSRSFRARLLEHEMTDGEITVGSSAGRDELSGTIVVGRDQVRVSGGTGETYLPIAGIAWVRARSE